MGKIKGFLFAVRHREILMTDLGLTEYWYYYPYEFLSDRGEKARKTVSRILSIEKKLGVKRRIPDHFPYLYGSTQWFSLTRSSVEKILDYTRNHPKFYRRSRFTFASEEYYMATILCNISSKENIIARDLRFIRWKNENNSYPAILTNEHFSNSSLKFEIKAKQFYAASQRVLW